jgi:hypothetical protein
MTVACDLSPGPGPHRACVPEGRPNTAARSIPKISFFKADTVLNTSTGDKSPAYFLVVPPGHTGTATALNVEMSRRRHSFHRTDERASLNKRAKQRKVGGAQPFFRRLGLMPIRIQ